MSRQGKFTRNHTTAAGISTLGGFSRIPRHMMDVSSLGHAPLGSNLNIDTETDLDTEDRYTVMGYTSEANPTHLTVDLLAEFKLLMVYVKLFFNYF